MEQTIKRETSTIRMRNYGRIIEEMVALASKEQDLQKRQDMVVYIAQCMRQKNAVWNKEQESGVERLRSDIQVLSHGVLQCDFPEFESYMKMLSLKPVPMPDMKAMGNMRKKKK